MVSVLLAQQCLCPIGTINFLRTQLTIKTSLMLPLFCENMVHPPTNKCLRIHKVLEWYIKLHKKIGHFFLFLFSYFYC